MSPDFPQKNLEIVRWEKVFSLLEAVTLVSSGGLEDSCTESGQVRAKAGSNAGSDQS